MKTILPLTLLLLLMTAGTAVSQTPIKARTESGKDVILSPDGTWKYATEVAPGAHTSTAATMTRAANAKSVYKAPHGGFSIWYDDSKWILAPKADEEGRIEFRLKRGDGYAVAIIEELGMPSSTLKEIALENAKSAAADTRIVFEETRTVNGKEVLCMKMEGSVKGIPFRYYGYYYGGKAGSIQLLTFTGTQIFAKYEQDFLEFLNGLQIDESKL
ncbi:MAG TPA: hypothetical protein VFR51_00520 [Pyrinomonadaceae bacterium]|nr:hypothetical protein [Pyrinomonadaceae bacterium]